MPFNRQIQHGSKTQQIMKDLSKGCTMYHPCPINYKCMAKASHLYKQCQSCDVPHATHNHSIRSRMIHRENFGITITKETGEKLLEASRRLDQKEN